MATYNGTNGSDTLDGSAGEDLIRGGRGDDSLNGGAGGDTYSFAKNDGYDLIQDQDGSVNRDIVRFDDLPSTEVAGFIRQGSDLVLYYGLDDQLTVRNFFDGTAYQIEAFQFSDGVVFGRAEIALRQLYTEGNDQFNGFADLANNIQGLGGHDRITGGSLADTLSGDAGDDALQGGSGNDTLSGGTGNDTLSGGAGNDTYLLGRGDGLDLLQDGASASEADVLKFRDVASTEVLAVIRSGGDLILRYGPGDQVTLQSYFLSENRVASVRFSDGVNWGRAAIAARVSGTEGNDQFTGFANVANKMRGLGGNDQLTGGDLGDQLEGNAGDDHLQGGAGDDTLVGGSGNDTLTGGAGNDTYRLSRGEGIDVVYNHGGTATDIDTLQFLDLASTDVLALIRSGSDLLLRYGPGDEVTLQGYFNGDSQVDAIRFSDGVSWDRIAVARIAVGTEGNDYLSGLAGVANHLRGGGGNDQLTGAALDDVLEGNAGDDTLYGDAGRDTLIGGTGSDTLRGGDGSDTYLFRRGDGLDRIQEYGGAPGDTDMLSFEDCSITSVSRVYRSGNDLVLRLEPRDGVVIADHFSGGVPGIEQYRFSDGTIVTGFVIGTEDNDSLYGHNGNDFFYSGGGNDVMAGKLGNDLYVVDHAGDKVVENRNEGVDTLLAGFSYSLETLVHVENLILTGSADLAGYGNATHNRLVGNAGANWLEGRQGNDTLDGQGGADVMSGLSGNDTYHVDHAGDRIEELEDIDGGYGGVDQVISTISHTLGTSLENLVLAGSGAIDGTGNAGNNTLQANAADNVLDGGAGIDTLSYAGSAVGSGGITVNLGIVDASGSATVLGGSGTDLVRNFENITGSKFADLLTGDKLANVLSGGNGNDKLDGAGGNDRLFGGLGNDTLTGGLGKDIFAFDIAPDAAKNRDTVSDFSALDDTIWLDNAVFQSLGATGALNAEYLRAGAGVTTAADTDDFILYDSSTGALYYDADGSGSAAAAVQFAALLGKPELGLADFWVF